MYRLPQERVALDLDGPTVTVEPILSWSIQQLALGKCIAYEQATTPEADLAALDDLFEFVVAEADIEWDIADHRGRIPETKVGMHRLPLRLAYSIATGWIGTYAEQVEPETAADKMLPPSELRDEVNRRLRAMRAA